MSDNLIHCPRCSSTQLSANKKGFSGKKAVAGVLLTGGVGLLAGTIGSNKIEVTCLACGKTFKPGSSSQSKTPDMSFEQAAFGILGLFLGSGLGFCIFELLLGWWSFFVLAFSLGLGMVFFVIFALIPKSSNKPSPRPPRSNIIADTLQSHSPVLDEKKVTIDSKAESLDNKTQSLLEIGKKKYGDFTFNDLTNEHRKIQEQHDSRAISYPEYKEQSDVILALMGIFISTGEKLRKDFDLAEEQYNKNLISNRLFQRKQREYLKNAEIRRKHTVNDIL